MTNEELLDQADAFAAVAGIELSDTDLEGILTTIADLTKRAIPAAAEVSVTLGPGAVTAAFTGEVARSLDQAQVELGHRPAMEALASGEIVVVNDMSSESRWPAFIARALAARCHSSLTVRLPVYESGPGVLNIYATEPQAFDEYTIVLAQAFAGYAAVALVNTHLYDAQITLAGHLQAALASRVVIEQAKGIIMGERGCTSDEAFRILTERSRQANRTLHEVARTLVDRAVETG
jgi:transcriptional regulator with GAF, ATPase, and Fis domain